MLQINIGVLTGKFRWDYSSILRRTRIFLFNDANRDNGPYIGQWSIPQGGLGKFLIAIEQAIRRVQKHVKPPLFLV